ncbi:MAG: hypothetical protein HDT28_01975 [Clostridiales bacterium]|nr:hypothetical protein [Clostridiales bacterium]
MEQDKWIVVPYTKYAVVRQSDFEESGAFKRAAAYGLDEDEAHKFCDSMNASGEGLNTPTIDDDDIVVMLLGEAAKDFCAEVTE